MTIAAMAKNSAQPPVFASDRSSGLVLEGPRFSRRHSADSIDPSNHNAGTAAQATSSHFHEPLAGLFPKPINVASVRRVRLRRNSANAPAPQEAARISPQKTQDIGDAPRSDRFLSWLRIAP